MPIAYLRPLLNNKGGVLVIVIRKGTHAGGKAKNYPGLIKKLSTIYNTAYNTKEIRVNTSEKGKYAGKLPHRVYKIKTNNSAREKAGLDLRILFFLKDKRAVNLEKASEKLKMTKKELKSSILRLNKITGILGDKFVKDIPLN